MATVISSLGGQRCTVIERDIRQYQLTLQQYTFPTRDHFILGDFLDISSAYWQLMLRGDEVVHLTNIGDHALLEGRLEDFINQIFSMCQFTRSNKTMEFVVTSQYDRSDIRNLTSRIYLQLRQIGYSVLIWENSDFGLPDNYEVGRINTFSVIQVRR